MLVWLAMAGCGLGPDRGREPVIPPERLYLDAPDQTLPTATVGEPYEAAIAVSGGAPPYVWSAADPPPGGLSLGTDGHLSGTPSQAGTFTFAARASDSEGRSKRALITLTVGLEPLVVRCGDRLEGHFPDSAQSPTGIDLADLANVAWIAVDLPESLTTRVDLEFENVSPSTLYVERPSEPLGSWDLDNLYVGHSIEGGRVADGVAVDAGTDPSLTGFAEQQLLPMVLVSQGAGDWRLDVVCSDGPVFVTLAQYPTERGLELAYDFDVYGSDNDRVRIWTDDPLPAWVRWDESTGIVTGTAEEHGAWEFTIHAETRDGRKRSESAIFGVFDVIDVPCGGSAPVAVTESYFDGDFNGYYDPRGFNVFRLDLTTEEPSALTLTATGSDGHYVGLATPNPDWLKFYGGADRSYIDGAEATLAVDPSTYPATHHFVEAEELFFSAGSIGTLFSNVRVEVECAFDPRPDLAALPVIDPFVPVRLPLDAIGGTPPYTWTATGLPVGLALSRDGVLSGSTGQAGTFPVELTVTDRDGGSGSGTWDLSIGTDAACLGFRRVYCGDSIDSEFLLPYYSDTGSRDSTRTLCIVDDSDENIGIELYSDEGSYRVDVADPGVSESEVVSPTRSTYVAYVDRNAVEGVSLDPFSWPDIDDYQGLPIFVTLRAYDPGEWTAHFVCTP